MRSAVRQTGTWEGRGEQQRAQSSYSAGERSEKRLKGWREGGPAQCRGSSVLLPVQRFAVLRRGKRFQGTQSGQHGYRGLQPRYPQ